MNADLEAPSTADPPAHENVGRKIIAGGTWRALAFGFASLLGIVMVAVVSRQLGPAEFALFTTVMSLVTVALSLSDAGLLALGIREYAGRSPADRERSQRALIGLRLISSAITSLGIIVFAVLKGYPEDVVWGLVAAGFGICGLSLCISYSVPLQATYRLGQVALLEAGRQALQMGLMIVVAINFANVGGLVAMLLPTGIVMAVAAGLMSRKLSPVLPSFDMVEMRSLMVSVGAFAVTAAIGANYAYVAQIVSNSMMDSHESGLFSLAFRVFVVGVAAFYSVVGGAFALLVTAVTESDRDRLAFATRRLGQSALLAGIGASVAFVTGASFAVRLLGGPEFADAVPVVALIGLSFPGSYFVYVGTMNLLADSAYRALIVRASSGAAASILATAVLANKFGAVGAAAGIIIGEYTLALAYGAKLASDDSRSLPSIGWILGAVAIGAVASSTVLLPLPSVICAAIAGVVYLALTVFFGLIPPELLHPVKSRLGFAV